MICPDDSTKPLPSTYGSDQISYTANAFVLCPTTVGKVNNTSDPTAIASSLAQMYAPATTVLLYEGQTVTSAYNEPGTGTFWQSNYAYLDNPTEQQSLVGDGSSNWYSVPLEVGRHAPDSPNPGVVRSGRLNFLAADLPCQEPRRFLVQPRRRGLGRRQRPGEPAQLAERLCRSGPPRHQCYVV